jgi:DNA polymerase III delta subunit
MLTIIHGDDTAASRSYYIQLKGQYPDGATLEGQMINKTDLAQVLEGGGLFSEEKTLFLENFVTKKKTSGDYKDIVAYLADLGKTVTIILWEGKELDKATLTPFKQSTVRPFKLPQSLFAFLDAIKPGNGIQLVKLFHQTLTSVEAEAVFAMLTRQTRLLLALHDTPSDIEEVKRMQDWQKSKLMNQARLFTTEQLTNIFCQLFVMEQGLKTGTMNSDITTAIDILLMDI